MPVGRYSIGRRYNIHYKFIRLHVPRTVPVAGYSIGTRYAVRPVRPPEDKDGTGRPVFDRHCKLFVDVLRTAAVPVGQYRPKDGTGRLASVDRYSIGTRCAVRPVRRPEDDPG